MVDPGCGARCAIRDTGAAGADRYYWTIAAVGEFDPVAAGRTFAGGPSPGGLRGDWLELS